MSKSGHYFNYFLLKDLRNEKIVLSFVAAALLSACSNSVEKMQTANDTYQNSDREIPSFSPLASGGVTLPQADPTYELPQLNAKKERVDIRPPSTPLAIIKILDTI